MRKCWVTNTRQFGTRSVSLNSAPFPEFIRWAAHYLRNSVRLASTEIKFTFPPPNFVSLSGMHCFHHIVQGKKRKDLLTLRLVDLVVDLVVDLAEVVVVVLLRGTHDPTLKVLSDSSLVIVSTPRPAVQLRLM